MMDLPEVYLRDINHNVKSLKGGCKYLLAELIKLNDTMFRIEKEIKERVAQTDNSGD